MNYRESQANCQGCGSTHAERKAARPTETYLGLNDCPQCGAEKCCMCDMGDDVECGNCDTGDTEP